MAFVSISEANIAVKGVDAFVLSVVLFLDFTKIGMKSDFIVCRDILTKCDESGRLSDFFLTGFREIADPRDDVNDVSMKPAIIQEESIGLGMFEVKVVNGFFNSIDEFKYLEINGALGSINLIDVIKAIVSLCVIVIKYGTFF